MKRSILAILLVMVLVFGLSSALVVTAYADTTEGGTVTVNETELDAVKGMYYANETFVYTPGSEAVKHFMLVANSINDYKGKEPSEVIALAGVTSTTNDESEITVADDADIAAKYYVFVDENADGSYSDLVEVCVDTVAPVIDETLFANWLATEDSNLNLLQLPAGDDYEFNNDWAEIENILTEATAQDSEGAIDEDALEITVEYCAPGDAYDSADWSVTTRGQIDLDEVGQWIFRYVVTDNAGNEGKTIDIVRYVKIMDGPEITFSSSVRDYEEDGVTAGVAFTIPTPTAKDALGNSLKATYVVYKVVDGKDVVIFDSTTDKTTEGYEDFISSGKLTPALNEVTDVSGDKIDYIYTVEYTVVDGNGNEATKELNIRVNAPVTSEEDVVETIWQWVLISLSVLSAVAIIFLLIAKPKTTDGRTLPADKNDKK